MKSYRDCEIKVIGSSKYSALTMTGNTENGVEAKLLSFGMSTTYPAYIVDDMEVEIGDYYDKVAEYKDWLRIYDDRNRSAYFEADTIEVFRAGDCGCIIRIQKG